MPLIINSGPGSRLYTAAGGGDPEFLFFYNYDSGTTASQNGVSLLTPQQAQGTVTPVIASPRGSTTALRMNIGNGSVDWVPEMRWQIDSPGYSELWIEYAVYFPDGTEGIGPAFDLIQTAGSHHFKQLRVGDGATHDDDSQMRFGASMEDSESMFIEYGGPGDPDFYVSPGPPPVDGGSTAMPPALGEWTTLKWHLKSPTVTPTDWGNSTGIIQLWVNGSLAIDIDGASQSTANRAMRNGYFFGAQTSCYVAANSKVDVTDIIFHTSDPSP